MEDRIEAYDGGAAEDHQQADPMGNGEVALEEDAREGAGEEDHAPTQHLVVGRVRE